MIFKLTIIWKKTSYNIQMTEKKMSMNKNNMDLACQKTNNLLK